MYEWKMIRTKQGRIDAIIEDSKGVQRAIYPSGFTSCPPEEIILEELKEGYADWVSWDKVTHVSYSTYKP
jgi:hypothetical protein